jgi:hypothetical protein
MAGQKHMSVMDTQKFVAWCNSIMNALEDRLYRDGGGRLTDDLAKYNQTRVIRDAALRGEFNIRLMEDNE